MLGLLYFLHLITNLDARIPMTNVLIRHIDSHIVMLDPAEAIDFGAA